MKRQRLSARRRIELRQRGRTLRFVPSHPSEIPRHAVYNELRAIGIDPEAKPTMETRRQSDHLLDKIRQASGFKSYKLADKRAYLANVMHAVKRAMYHDGCVMYSRNKNHPDFKAIHTQVIDALIETEMVYEHRSPKGSPKMSRLLPMPDMHDFASCDPWDFDPNAMQQFVYLQQRDTKAELPVDWRLPIARECQERLELINRVNSHYDISYEQYSKWRANFVGRKQLRPIHYAVFTDHWDMHGRLYTGRYGHQGLRKIERRTIEFNGCPCVELDFGGTHPRLLYHLKGIDYRKDPYAFWGDNTDEAQRLLAKKVLNAAINAKTRRAAIDACNESMSTRTKRDRHGNRQRKEGKQLEDAISLREAYNQSDMSFGELYDLAEKRHKPIAEYFASDAGMWLMRVDSSIALDVMYDFAKQAIPCLGCHDSFIVPQHHAAELRERMNMRYSQHLNHLPIVK